MFPGEEDKTLPDTELQPDEALYGDEPEEEEAGEEVKAEAEEAEKPEDEPDETSEEEDKSSEEDVEAKSEDEEAESLSSLEEFDFDGKDVKDFTLNVTIDGETNPVKVGELIKSYQIDGAGEKRLAEANALKDQAKTQLEVQQQQWKASMELLQPAVQAQAQEMHVNWLKQQLDASDLRQTDPAEYMARKGELDEALKQVEQTKAQLRQQAQANQSEMSEKQKAEATKWLQNETQKLIEVKPELADKKNWTDWADRLKKFAIANGFKAEDVENVQDHRLLLILDKAMRLDEGLNTGRRKRKAKPIKTVKSGARSEPKPKPKDAAEILYG